MKCKQMELMTIQILKYRLVAAINFVDQMYLTLLSCMAC